MDEYELKKQVENWKAIALWLADCHAATASYDGQLKSCSKARKHRLNDICYKAAEMIERGYPVNIRNVYLYNGQAEHVVERLREVSKP